jgi:hypothetical protein
VIRSSIFSSLLLSLVLVAGCKKEPDGVNPPTDGGGDPTADTKGGGKKKPGKDNKTDGTGDTGNGADENDPTKKVCPAETADFPEPYFEQTVLLRLPKGVTSDNFVESQPGFAALSGDIESVSCVPDSAGAVISHMALASFPDDPAKDMNTWRDEVIEAFGYTGAALSEEKVDAKKRHYTGVLDLPGGEGEPAKALLTLVAANGFMYALVMETHPNAWNALKETFYLVSSKMSFLKPA